MRGIFYRSDTRIPLEIFDDGFEKRDLKFKNPQERFIKGTERAPDIEPSSAVCFTRHFEAAAIFPVDDLKTESWVYVLDLDTKDIWNTQLRQYELMRKIKKDSVEAALWPMFGQERAVNSIEPHDIVGAVRINRRFNGASPFMGGDFTPLQYKPNDLYSGPTTTAKLVADEITLLIGAKLKIPTQTQGVVKSTKK